MTGSIGAAYHVFACLLILLLRSAAAVPATVLVGEKEKHCFFVRATANTKYSASVFVFNGGSLTFSISGPIPLDASGNPKSDQRKAPFLQVVVAAEAADDDSDDTDESLAVANTYEFDATPGEYELCLSNDRRFEQKAKHAMLDVSEGLEDKRTKDSSASGNDPPSDEGLALISHHVQRLARDISMIEKMQNKEHMGLTKRRTGAEKNHDSMVRSSFIETAVLLVVSVGQIFFVRRWFQGKGTLLKQWA